jgi:hypothetical protein
VDDELGRAPERRALAADRCGPRHPPPAGAGGTRAQGRSEEQARFRAELADAVRAFQQTEDLSRLERVVEGWYRHAVMLRYDPGWADKLDRLRPGESEAGHRGPFTFEEALEDLGLPNPR